MLVGLLANGFYKKWLVFTRSKTSLSAWGCILAEFCMFYGARTPIPFTKISGGTNTQRLTAFKSKNNDTTGDEIDTSYPVNLFLLI